MFVVAIHTVRPSNSKNALLKSDMQLMLLAQAPTHIQHSSYRDLNSGRKDPLVIDHDLDRLKADLTYYQTYKLTAWH